MVEKKAKKKSVNNKETVLLLCAHSDDQILGAGATLAKYAEEGKRVIIVVFSYGEKANPWLKKEVTIDIRVKESKQAGKIIGAEQTLFLGLDEGKFAEQIRQKKTWLKISDMIKKYKPIKIFTHSADDPHPDHNTLANAILELCDKNNYQGDLLSFDIWNPVKLHRNSPRVYIDVTSTFSKKLKALKCFDSQLLSMLALTWGVYFKAIKYGFASKSRFAELFYKMR